MSEFRGYEKKSLAFLKDNKIKVGDSVKIKSDLPLRILMNLPYTLYILTFTRIRFVILLKLPVIGSY